MEIILLMFGVIVGFLAAWFVSKFKYAGQKGPSKNEVEDFNNQIVLLKTEKSRVEGKSNILEENLIQVNFELTSEREKTIQLNSELSSVKSDFSNLKEKLDTQKNEMEKLQEKFTVEFKNIANEILEDKSKRFTEQNKTNLSEILNPLNDKIKDFEKKVEQTYEKESRDRISLYTEIKYLKELNQKISEEANNLTNALKGQSKTQGNWGEIILESILEKSGLTRDREYFVQESLVNSEGKRYQPDVIINLPEEKHIVVDSKMSLTAYERYCSAVDENEKESALKEHILSVRKHIKELSQKNYQNLYEMKSLDFVFMFIPIEPAFALAVQSDANILNEAYEKNIVMISISTLLVSLRLVANLWRIENQNRNAQEIAKQAGDLYDKFVSFTEDLMDIGKKLDATRKTYDESIKKLYEGSGNLVRRAQNIKQLGAKTSKSIHQNLLDWAQ
jgi:DNA recombination protein RmuC